MNNSTEPNNGDFEKAGTAYAISLIVINACSSLVACVLNFLIILTFITTPSMRAPSNILILCLAIADFGVGAVLQPVYCVELFAKMKAYESMFYTTLKVRAGSSFVLLASSLLTITAITIDRFLALHLHLRYQELVTTKRSCIVVIVIVTISPFVFFAEFSPAVRIFCVSGLVVLSILDVLLMVKLSRTVRKHLASIHTQEQSVQQNSLNLPRYKKTVNTMYYIMGAFAFCYIPFTATNIAYITGPYEALPIHYRRLLDITLDVTNTLMFINSSLNPVIYFWRIQDMRNAVMQLFLNIQCLN